MKSRLPAAPREWIDRTKSIAFTFEGRRFEGLAGDSVTSALWAAGERLLGRSFKYHRPRGVLSLANHDVNAMFQWGARLNLRGDVAPLEDGMVLTAVNTYGGLASDRARLLDQDGRVPPGRVLLQGLPQTEVAVPALGAPVPGHHRTRAGPLRHAPSTDAEALLAHRSARHRRRRGRTVRRRRGRRIRRASGAGGREPGAGREPRIPAWRQGHGYGSAR